MALTNFIPALWSARLLAHLDNVLIARRFFNTDWEGEITDMGDRVKINQIGNVNVFEYTRNQDMAAPQILSGDATDLLIDFARAFNFYIDDIDNAQSNPKLMDAAMARAAFALNEATDTWLLGKIVEGVAAENTIGSDDEPTPVSTADDVYVLLTKLRTFLVKANIPIEGRMAALPPELVELALQDDRFVKTGGTQAESTLASGVIARAAGFDIMEVNTIPGGNKIITGHSISGTMATQISKVEGYRPEKRFGDAAKGLFLAGSEITRPNGYAVATVEFE